MAWNPPPLPQTQPDWLSFQIWWQQVIEDIGEQFTAQAGLIADIQTALSLANSNIALLQAVIAANSGGSGGSGSGGGTAASDNSLTAFNSNTHAAVSDVLTVLAGSSGIVTLSASSLAVSTTAAAPATTFPVYGKWQWDSTGAGVWVDVGTEDISSPHAEVVDYENGYYGVNAGSLTSNESKTGLTPSSSYKFRFMARTASGTRTMYLTGTASAVGS